jgi:hypothetical protein
MEDYHRGLLGHSSGPIIVIYEIISDGQPRPNIQIPATHDARWCLMLMIGRESGTGSVSILLGQPLVLLELLKKVKRFFRQGKLAK